MNARSVRAQLVLEEARALGLELADLVAADAGGAALPTLANYVREIEPNATTQSGERSRQERSSLAESNGG